MTNRICAGVIAAGLLVVSLVDAQSKSTPAKKKKVTYTTVQVVEMHCMSCAKKIAARLYKVGGVKEVRADVKTDRAYIIPSKKKAPTPYEMWVAVEKAGSKPVKMWGPAGTFTKRPAKPAALAAKAAGTKNR